MVSLDFTKPIKDDDIIGWKSDRGWLYLTLLGVRAPNNLIPTSTFNGVVKEIVLDDFDESIQVAILVGRPIVGYDIVNSPGVPTTVVFIHTEMRKSEVYSLKKHIEKSGSSIFGQVKTSRFPEYNTDFESAFKKARVELGPNSIFRYDGKLFTTNHPEEEKSKVKDALRSKPEGFTQPDIEIESIDGEFYTNVPDDQNKVKIVEKVNVLDTKEDEKQEKRKETDRNKILSIDQAKNITAKKTFGSRIRSIFSKIIPKEETEPNLIDSVNAYPDLAVGQYENQIEQLLYKIEELEEGIKQKETILTEQKSNWERRAEERQTRYREQVTDLEDKLIELEKLINQKKTFAKNEPYGEKLFLSEQEKLLSKEKELEKKLSEMEKKFSSFQEKQLEERRQWELLNEKQDLQYRAQEEQLEKNLSKEEKFKTQIKLLELKLRDLEKEGEIGLEEWESLTEKQERQYKDQARLIEKNSTKEEELRSQISTLEDKLLGLQEQRSSEQSKWEELAEKEKIQYQKRIQELEKNLLRETQLKEQMTRMEEKMQLLEEDRGVQRQKWESLAREREIEYRTRAQDLEMKLYRLESNLAQKDRELFEEKNKWELLSDQKQEKYRKKAKELESQLAELERVIQMRDENLYAEKDKWRKLAKERQEKIDEYDPLVENFNNQLEEMRKELLSDLYDEKLMLTEDEKSKNRNLGEFVVGLKKRFFDEKTEKEEWIDSIYLELAEEDFSFQEYFSLALPDESESIEEPSTLHKEKIWREDLIPSERNRYETSGVDPVFQYYYNGGIRVETNMAGVPIYINGNLVGDTPISTPVQVEPGWHQVSGFSPVYKQVADSEGLTYVGSDPIIRNNQLYGAKTIFVESGKIADVSLKFNNMGNVPKKWKELRGGWAAGLPMVLLLVYFVSWSL
tara:strand:- start:1079 stop:3802 length:2724 start_codon:yes stop_codon:yes gene_type:complete